MTDERFVARYRVVVFAIGAVWNAWLNVTLGGLRTTTIAGFFFDMIPVLALWLAAGIVRRPMALVVIAIAHFGTMAHVARSVIGARSSTAPVAVALATIASTGAIVVAAAVGALCSWAHRARCRSRESRN